MMLARRIAPIAAVLLLAAACGSGAGGGPALSDDALSERLADYYQKSVSSPGVTFKVVKLEDAGMPGWRKGTMVASLGQQSQNIGFYVTADGHYSFRGDLTDLTVDPLEQTMSKISLDNQPERGPREAEITKDNQKNKAGETAKAGGLDVPKFQECFDGRSRRTRSTRTCRKRARSASTRRRCSS